MGKRLELCLELEENFGLNHFYIRDYPPQIMDLSKSGASDLNTHNSHPVNELEKNEKRFSNGFVIVQVMHAAEKHSLFFGDNPSKKRSFLKNVESWETHFTEDFFLELKDGIENTLHALEAYPCLWVDFQIFIGPSGKVYQLDLNRCSNKNKTKKYKQIYQRIKYIRSLPSTIRKIRLRHIEQVVRKSF
jgi:hypothetical protein